jgi:hypothetical protein
LCQPWLVSPGDDGQYRIMIVSLLIMTSTPVFDRRLLGDPIAQAVKGLNAVIEDDIHPDTKLISMKTKKCETRVVAAARQWTINWTKAETVALEDTFVYVVAPPVKFAIVGDASKPDQAAKLQMLTRAMRTMADLCRPKR